MLVALAFLPYSLLCQQSTLSRQRVPKEVLDQAINAILEDSHGFIWMGGRRLYKYDGFQSRVYLPEPNDSTAAVLGCHVLMEDRSENIWIGSASGLFRYDREADELVRCFQDIIQSEDGGVLNIFALYEDSSGKIWVGGENKIFVIEDLQEERIQLIEGWDKETNHQIRRGIRCLVEDNKGEMYVGTSSGFWQIKEDHAIVPHSPSSSNGREDNFFVIDLKQGEGDTLWLATSAGLWVFESNSKRFSKMALPGDPDQAVRKLFIDEYDRLWVAQSNGVFLRYPNGEYEGFTEVPFHFPRSLFRDRFGNLWVAKATGVHVLAYDWHQKFPVYQIESSSRYQDNFFFFTAQDSSGGYWFRLFRTGLGYAAKLDTTLEVRLQPVNQYFVEEIKSFCVDPDGHVWVITFSSGLYQFENGGPTYRQLELGDSLKTAEPLIVLSDQQDQNLLWVSTRYGLCSIDRFTFKIRWYHPSTDLPWLNSDALSYIEQAADGNIWGAVRTGAERTFVCFDKTSEQFVSGIQLPHRIKKETAADMKRVPGDQIWVGEKEGLSIIDTKQRTGTLITEANGLPTPSVGSITVDQLGNIWYSFGQQVCKYDGATFTCYHTGNEIGQFLSHSSTLNQDGRVVFGSSEGLLVFEPEKVTVDTIPPKVILTNFQVFNTDRALEMASELVQEITLPFEDNIISFEFSALHFNHSDLLKFQYKLEGFEEDWVETGSLERQATYTNLSPGVYTFKAMAANVDGLWTTEEEQLHIKLIILPPWYRTWWAYTLWITLILGGFYWFYRVQLNRRLALAEAHRLKELNEVKSRLYSNITHEFRTPLTIILGMMEQMKKDPKNWFSEGARLIRRNGRQLLNLVNQMLDLSKLEAGHMPLKLVNGDMVSFLDYIIESFHSYADSKDIRIHFLTDQSELWMDFDPEKLRNVISNLISNSIKFTPAGGNIYVDLELESPSSKLVTLQIRDDGIGIAAEHLPFIFDRFYQVDTSNTRRGQGTGIGLALSKELVLHMHGTIEAQSPRKEGTQITINLPFTQAADKTPLDQPQEKASLLADALYLPHEEKIEVIEVVQNDRSLILLVEDNADVLTYLGSFLASEYQIVTAKDGQEGINKALELIPDLIVSDVMMPEKDGYELCETLKADNRTNHIPIILLTAKADQAAKLEGLSQGADAYLAKPFHQQELLIRIEKLIAVRQQMQQRFQQEGALFQTLRAPKKSAEELFLQKVLAVIERNLADENFGMPQLCKSLHMSRSHLFRKLKAITGKSATHLIRSMRIEKAKELLLTTQLNVTEVCFEVGFNNPRYFSRVFQEELGILPSELRKKGN